MTDRDTLQIWTIYDHPSDFPEHFVVTVSEVTARGVIQRPERWLRQTIHEARAVIRANDPRADCPMGRAPDDDPAIVEVWL